MLKITEEELNFIIHDLVRIAGILKCVENGSLTTGQRQILQGCETRLNEVREKILQSVKENGNGDKKSS